MYKVKTFLQNSGSKIWNWCANKAKPIVYDYKAAGEDLLLDMKQRPIKAAIYTTIFATGLYSYHHVPTESNFHGTLVEASTDLMTIGDDIINDEAYDHTQHVYGLYSKDMLRYKWMGLFSIVYSSDYDKHNKAYLSQCKYTNPRWNEIYRNVIDIGFCDTWWVLKWKMVDYDVNFKEFPLEFESIFERYAYILKRVFGFSYFSNLTSQPLVTSYYVNMEDKV